MIFTEKEAATKRCTPMQIISLMQNCEDRRGAIASGSVELNCIGSRCAQWRWLGFETDEGEMYGYCGLAGRP